MVGERYAATLRGFRTGRIQGVEDPGPAIELDLDGGRGELSVAAHAALRLRVGSEFLPDPAEACAPRGDWRPIGLRLRESPTGGFVLGSQGFPFRVEVEAKPFRLRLLDRHDLAWLEVGELRCDAGGGVAITLPLAPGESVHGLADAAPRFDLRESRVTLDLGGTPRRGPGPRFAIPFLLLHRSDPRGPGACGVLLDHFGACHFDVGAESGERLEIRTESGGLDLMLLPGAGPAAVLEAFTARVGRGTRPPRWALGHQLAVSAGSARQLRRRLRRRAALPASALHLELPTARKNASAAWPERGFPDAPTLLAELEKSGLHGVLRLSPAVAVAPEDPRYRDGLAQEVFLEREDGSQLVVGRGGRRALPDLHRADARSWWAALQRPLLEGGAAGFWADPADSLPRGRQAARIVTSHPAREEQRVAFEAYRHLYLGQMARAAREVFTRVRPEDRGFVLASSGGTGIQREAAALFDAGGGWSGLREGLARQLALSLSGVAFSGPELGGAADRCSPELFARWFQLASLLPLARSRAGRRPGRRVESIAAAALGLRARLAPYLEALLRDAAECGAPPCRPLFYEFPDDPAAIAVDDQFLLGPVLLVAPVLDAGARERELYLPEGEWFDWYDDALYRGPRRLRVSAALDRLPLFVRAGAVLPTLWGDGASKGQPLLEVFPGGDRRFDWVEDDGATTRFRQGEEARTPLRLWGRAGGRLRLELARREGDYPIAGRTLCVQVRACPGADAVMLDASPLARGEGVPGWQLRDGRLLLRLQDTGRGAGIEIEPAP